MTLGGVLCADHDISLRRWLLTHCATSDSLPRAEPPWTPTVCTSYYLYRSCWYCDFMYR